MWGVASLYIRGKAGELALSVQCGANLSKVKAENEVFVAIGAVVRVRRRGVSASQSCP